jgi:hypothetical protein
MDQALDEKRDYATHLGRNVNATVKASGICVDIRQYWLPPNQTEVVPTKKRITLRPSEYAKLKDVVSVIGDFQSSIITNVIHNVFTSSHNDLGCIHYMIRNPTDSCGRIGMDKVLSNSVLEQSHQLH